MSPSKEIKTIIVIGTVSGDQETREIWSSFQLIQTIQLDWLDNVLKSRSIQGK